MRDDLIQRARDAAGRLGKQAKRNASNWQATVEGRGAAIIAELIERVEWQPMETFAEPTALSSGEGVLIACADGSVGEAYFRNFDGGGDGWWWSNTSWGDYPEPDRPSPVAWMLLPPPPSVLGKQEGEG